MPAGQQLPHQAPPSANGETTPHDLFVLTDEQILEIEPEREVNVAPGFSPASFPARVPGNEATRSVISSEARNLSSSAASQSSQSKRDSSSPSAPRDDTQEQSAPAVTERGARATSHESPVTNHDSAEPPAWLAAQMKDPWSGEEARELWNGVVQARQEAAAYRAAIPTPEDARALKELYPGGIPEARAAAGRARLLEEIDGAYFGAAGRSPQEVSASRANLAQHLLREDPAAFREMVFAGLRALEEAEKGSGATSAGIAEKTVAAVFRPRGIDSNGPRDTTMNAPPSEEGGYMKSYAAFEKAANEDLDRSVGAAIERTLQQALPNLKESSGQGDAGARQSAPLRDRLGLAVRQDVEAALKGDRQLGEQIAQILSARRFDNETRAQVVRLIDDRARQLVPAAAKRVINDWTHATLAAHRGNASRSDAATSRREVASANTEAVGALVPTSSSRAAQAGRGTDPHRNASRSDARRLDYRKLSDEQILEL